MENRKTRVKKGEENWQKNETVMQKRGMGADLGDVGEIEGSECNNIIDIQY